MNLELPKWANELDSDKYYLVLTDDMDSYHSCGLLQKIFPNLEVGGFYNYKGLFLNEKRTIGKKPIYIDADMVNERCIGNHQTVFKNENSINLNNNINQYFKKYGFSTLLIIMGVFKYDIKKMTQEQIAMALCIDGGYVGYFNKGGIYKNVSVDWLKFLHLESFIKVLESNKKELFKKTIKTKNLTEKIHIKNGYLSGKIGVRYGYKFELVEKYSVEFLPKEEMLKFNKDTIFSSAETFNGKCVMSRKIEKGA